MTYAGSCRRFLEWPQRFKVHTPVELLSSRLEIVREIAAHAGTEALHMHYRHRGRCWVFLSRVPPLMAFVSAFVGASPTLPDVTTVGLHP